MKTPIALLVDDGCPRVHVFFHHWHHWEGRRRRRPHTADGRPLVDVVADAFLDRFCDVAERWHLAGKFSIVPAPAGLGDVVRGVAGDLEATRAWIATARRRLGPRFDFTPEGITHHLAVDVATGASLAEDENAWSRKQTRATLTPYVTRALSLLRDAGIDAAGVTSPWTFGIDVEPEYVASIVAAQRAVYRRTLSFYFLHMLHDRPSSRPWIAWRDAEATLVSIPSTVADFFWATIDSPRTDAAFVGAIADHLLTADGRGGRIREVLDAGGWPAIVTHWQSLYSNGLETGLAALDELGRRVAATLGAEVEWCSCLELAERTAR